VHLSARTGAGLDLLPALLQVAGWQRAPKACTSRARASRPCAPWPHLMEAAAQLTSDGPALDLLAELRLAQNALNSITGEFSADDLLG
jgi:tRNA modification GTPase